jgi:putative membrane protein
MLDLVIRIVINAIALVAAIRLVPDADFDGGLVKLIAVAAVFGVMNAYLRPIVKALSLPLTLLTFGLVGLVINTALLMLLALLSGQLGLGLTLHGWPPGAIDLNVIITAVLAALVVSIVSTLLALTRRLAPGM